MRKFLWLTRILPAFFASVNFLLTDFAVKSGIGVELNPIAMYHLPFPLNVIGHFAALLVCLIIFEELGLRLPKYDLVFRLIPVIALGIDFIWDIIQFLQVVRF